MNFIKRISRLVLVNLAVVLTISIILFIIQKFFGINIWTRSGNILIFASIIWFGGAFISLYMSKISAKSAYNMTIITDENLYEQDPKVQSAYSTIVQMSQKLNITTPEVWVYNAQEPNAFATWSSKNNSLIAVSTGLLTLMKDDEVKWVLGHEMAHIINWDMVTMTLLNWVLNTFVFWLSRVLSTSMKSDDEKSTWGNFFLTMILEYVFGFAGMIMANRFSRFREYRADIWSTEILWDKSYMISALQKLQLFESHYEPSSDNYSTLKIISGKSFMNLFATHPPLEDRIAALQQSK